MHRFDTNRKKYQNKHPNKRKNKIRSVPQYLKFNKNDFDGTR